MSTEAAARIERRVPLQRPFVAALAVVLEHAGASFDARAYADRPWVDFARSRGTYGLVDLSERLWAQARCSYTVATDDARYINTVADALTSMLQALLWVTTMRQCGEVPTSLIGQGPEPWLIGAWPVQQPRMTPKTLEWPNPMSMDERELVVSMQNATLHMAFALCKRMTAMGIAPPAVEMAA